MTWTCKWTAYTGRGDTPCAAMADLLSGLDITVEILAASDRLGHPTLTREGALSSAAAYILAEAILTEDA